MRQSPISPPQSARTRKFRVGAMKRVPWQNTNAEVYEAFFVPALFEQWAPRILQAAGVAEGSSVLDVACGTGVLARAALKESGSHFVIGVDVDAEMLNFAHDIEPAISWVQGSAEKLPFPADSFNHALCQFGLMFFEDQVQGLVEMKRVVNSGGTVSIVVWAERSNTPVYVILEELLETFFGSEAVGLLDGPYALDRAEILHELFEQAELKDRQLQKISGTARFASIESWAQKEFRDWIIAAGYDQAYYRKFVDEARLRLKTFTAPDQSFSFDKPAFIVVANV
jgi:ubiquinone/menaquinone biosynthesis C-methylase UbiE